MRTLSLAVLCLLWTTLAPGQAIQPVAPNALHLTKFAFGTSNLDRSYAFYLSIGLDLDNATALRKPSSLSPMLLKLVEVPAGANFRNMMLKIPGAAFGLEVTEFSNLELRTAPPRIQDPGASLLIFTVDNLDAALTAVRKEGAGVVTEGGSPVAGRNVRAVTIRDPDGHYVELVQPRGIPSGSGKVIGASFGFMVVRDSEKAASFYRDGLGFKVKLNGWTANSSATLGTPGAQTRSASVTVPGATPNLSLGLMEFKGVDPKTYLNRIPDPTTSAIGLQVRDINAAVAAVKAAGGISITQGGSVQLGKGRVGFVRDPSGILIELAQP